MVRILKNLKEKHPDKDMDQLIQMANYSALLQKKKSRAFYRVQATRRLIGAGNVLRKHAADHARRVAAAGGLEDDLATCSRISFESAQYQCTENCGTLCLGVIVVGGTGQNTFYVDYRTENGSANAGADYVFCEGTLVFKPGETWKEIKVREGEEGGWKIVSLVNKEERWNDACKNVNVLKFTSDKLNWQVGSWFDVMSDIS